MSQLELALEAEISARHLSFVETGRAQPSRDMIVHLSETLAVPLRERNAILLAAGFAPLYAERTLDDPALAAARAAVDIVLQGCAPFPALAVDRRWNIVAFNAGAGALLDGVAPDLIAAPNAMRLALHPQALAPRILNFGEWRAHLLARLRQQIAASGDTGLAELLSELLGYAYPETIDLTSHEHDASGDPAIVVPLRLRDGGATLSFISTITVFGTPVDVTLSELAIETFFPADAATGDFLRGK
mgnify:CR=1 FL=1